jgi:hypothetical protein
MKLESPLACCLSSLQQKQEGASGCHSTLLALISQNASHVQAVRQRALNSTVCRSYYLTNIMDSSRTICKDSLANFWYVFWHCACQWSSRILVVIVDRCSSALGSVCTIKNFRFGSWHYLWRIPVAFGRFLQQLFNDKQNLIKVLFSVILVVKISPDHQNITSQKRTELNNMPSKPDNCWHTDLQSIATSSSGRAYGNQSGRAV